MTHTNEELDGAHRFGGSWTDQKLAVLGAYLRAYTTALKNQPFKKLYIDAFAGTGYRLPSVSPDIAGETLFPELTEDPSQRFLDGSARIALKTDPRFDEYIFIERERTRCDLLEQLSRDHRSPSTRVRVVRDDANTSIRTLCSGTWRGRRAVLFLDPYGMQVQWATIEAVAATQAIDLWLLFPLGMAVNRMLTRSGDVPDSWRRRLDAIFGTRDWYNELYRVERSPTLFDGDEEKVVKAGMDRIGEYFNDRLKTVFAGVAPKPRVLHNSNNCPLYLLCFAAGNQKGAPVALKIANHLLNGVR